MCGIFFSISEAEPNPISSYLKSCLQARGPDSLGEFEDRTSSLCISAASTVLALRHHLVKQPFTDADTGCVLCWNGEAWKFNGTPVVGNDGEAVFTHLVNATRQPSPHDAVLQVLRAIDGPFSFIFYCKPMRCLYYGRDRLGRRSLLVSHRVDVFTLCSVADMTESGLIPRGSWIEVEANGIYSVQISSTLAGLVPTRDPWLTSAPPGVVSIFSLVNLSPAKL